MIVNFNNIKQEKNESEPLPERIDTGKAIITDPVLIAKYAELEKKEKTHTATVKESRQYYRLKKHGDSTQAKNKLLQKPSNTPSRQISLEQANNNPITPTAERAKNTIEAIYNGKDFITACKDNDIRPKDFYILIDKPEFSEEKQNFFRARCLLAEYYLYKRESLEKDLLNGRIDSATYSTLANDYKYLAGKLHPAAYGDKIQLDAQINKQSTVEVLNTDKIKALSDMISGAIDAEFEEISEK